MNAYDGQDVLDLYRQNLKAQLSEQELRHIRDTKITLAQFRDNGIQFRFESNVGGKLPICQYVILKHNGEMEFRDEWAWFTPGDTLFQTFDEARCFAEGVNKAFSQLFPALG